MLLEVIQSKKVVAFIGLGRRSTRAAQSLIARGCEVRILERRTEQEYRQVWQGAICRTSEELSQFGIIWGVDGEALTAHLHGVSCAILSPGVSSESSVVGTLSRREIPVYSHLELDLLLGEGDSVVITGTNGKTSTARMLSTMIGCPLGVDSQSGESHSYVSSSSALVLTASAFEIESSYELKPSIAACVNGFPVHLERYGSPERYLKMLCKAFEKQDEKAFRVINLDDVYVAPLCQGMRSKLVGVSRFDRPAFREQCCIFVQICDQSLVVSDVHKQVTFHLSQALGSQLHNRYNAGIAAGIASALHVPEQAIQSGLSEGMSVAYRQNWHESGPTRIPICNDSKSTNVYATRASLDVSVQRYPERGIVLLVGGIAVEGDWFSLFHDYRNNISRVVCYGADASLLATYCDVVGVESIKVQSFGEAVTAGVSRINSGNECVLICSPGCLSFDEFGSFEERGAAFDRNINRLGLS